MNSNLRIKIEESISNSDIQGIANSTEFYFQKAKDALQHFLQLEVSEEVKNLLLARRKNYNELKQLFENSSDFLLFGNAIFTVISYCDTNAHRKNEFNNYDDKRVLALAFVRMNNWVEQLITYKFENNLGGGSVRNAIEYLLNPIDHFTMLSENHRNQLSQNLFKKPYNRVSFKNDFFDFFSQFPIGIVNPENKTHVLTRVCYALANEWKDSIIGLISPDSTGWQDEAVQVSENGQHIVLWNHKRPNGTATTLKLLRQCIEDNGYFRIFYTSAYKVKFVAEIIDFAENQQELSKVQWPKAFGEEIGWYYDSFDQYKDGDKGASWIYLARSIKKADPDDFNEFRYYGNYGYPSVGGQAPVVSYLTKTEVNNRNTMQNQLAILQYKKQIILQGPPGTGKTRLAKEIAKELTSRNTNVLTKDRITELCETVQTIPAARTKMTFKILGTSSSGVRVENSEGTENIAPYDEIISMYENTAWEKEGAIINGTQSYSAAVAKFLYNSLNKNSFLGYLKIIQFHPSYSYEDFVRGIVAKPNPDGEGMLYEAENKTLGAFAKQALDNYIASSNSGSDNNLDLWVNEKFEDFKNELQKETEKNEVILSGEITLFKVEHDNFRYGKDWATPSRINFTDFKKLIKAIAKKQLSFTSQQIPKELSVHAHYRNTYYMALLKKFDDSYQYNGETYTEPKKNYVLIIDEINRANLSSVLGELIYALEYRGEKVESMYDADGKDLILPPNLYIIGTMNTADRSVGHIDYAIRRRFAFVDVEPERLQDTDEIYFNSTGYDQVAALFNENNVSREFDIKDVQIGHSYFIAKKEEATDLQKRDAIFKLKMNYEVVPILLEYIKDGILINSFNDKPIKDYINKVIKVQ